MVMARLRYNITILARLRKIVSSPASTMLPPSNGRIGSRLNNPITGPAHHMARAAFDEPTPGCSGCTPIAHSASTLTPIWIGGPGEADARPLPPLQVTGRHERCVAGEEVE